MLELRKKRQGGNVSSSLFENFRTRQKITYASQGWPIFTINVEIILNSSHTRASPIGFPGHNVNNCVIFAMTIRPNQSTLNNHICKKKRKRKEKASFYCQDWFCYSPFSGFKSKKFSSVLPFYKWEFKISPCGGRVSLPFRFSFFHFFTFFCYLFFFYFSEAES